MLGFTLAFLPPQKAFGSIGVENEEGSRIPTSPCNCQKDRAAARSHTLLDLVRAVSELVALPLT